MNIFDAACDFPWPHGMCAHLDRYITSADHFIALAHDLQAKSINNAISLETDPVALGELQYELERLKEEDSILNQRLIWGGLLVSIYAAFEHGLEQIFEHWRKTTNSSAFRAKNGEDVVAAAIRHSSEHLELQLFKTTQEQESLNQLRILRKSFVHKGGRYISIPSDIWSEIQSKKDLGFPMEVLEDRWVANPFAVQHYLKVTNHVLRRFSDEVFAKILLQT